MFPTVEQIRDAVRNRPHRITYAQLATHCQIEETWIRQFMCGDIKEPGYTKATKLFSCVQTLGVAIAV